MGNRRAVSEGVSERETVGIKRTKERKSLTRGTGKWVHRGTGRQSNKCVYEKDAKRDKIKADTSS